MTTYGVPLMKHTFLHEAETKKALATFILNSERLSMGAECEAFENKLVAYGESIEEINIDWKIFK